MTDMTKKTVALALALWTGLAGALPFSYGDEVNVPGPAGVNAELKQDAISVQAMQQGQAQVNAQLQQMTMVEAAVAECQTEDELPEGVRTPNGDKILYLSGYPPENPFQGSTYLAIYDVATKTTRYQRVPEQGYAYYSGQEIEAVSQTHALVSFDGNGELYAVDLQNASAPMRSIDTSWTGSSSIHLKAAFFLGDNKTAAVAAGEEVRFLDVPTMTWVTGPSGATLTPDGSKLVYFSGTTPTHPQQGSTFLAVFNFNTGTTQYSPRIPKWGYSNHPGQKVEAISNTIALVSFVNGRLYQVNLENPAQGMKSVTVPGSASSGIQVEIRDDKTAAVISGDVLKKAYWLALDTMTLTETQASRGVYTPQWDKFLTVTATTSNNSAFGSQQGLKFLLAVYDVATGVTTYKNFSGISPTTKITQLVEFQIDAISPYYGGTAVVRGPDEAAHFFLTKDASTTPWFTIYVPGYKVGSRAEFLGNGTVRFYPFPGNSVYEFDIKTGQLKKIK